MCCRHREQARSHIGFSMPSISVFTANPCGSELARDSGGSACIDIECAAVIASRLAPTLVFRCLQYLYSQPIPVGASLLAIAVGQLALISNVLPSSRASSLPHWFFDAFNICIHSQSLWERACSR